MRTKRKKRKKRIIDDAAAWTITVLVLMLTLFYLWEQYAIFYWLLQMGGFGFTFII